MRQGTVSQAKGSVLEIGIGAGEDLPLYSTSVREIVKLEPSPRLLDMARAAADRSERPAELVNASAEAMPFDNSRFDTVVLTWTLCSIPDSEQAFAEMSRVLKPGDRLLFAEHGFAPEVKVQRWQGRLTPLWKRVAGGCHLNRPIAALIENAGFRIDRLDTGYMPVPAP